RLPRGATTDGAAGVDHQERRIAVDTIAGCQHLTLAVLGVVPGKYDFAERLLDPLVGQCLFRECLAGAAPRSEELQYDRPLRCARFGEESVDARLRRRGAGAQGETTDQQCRDPWCHWTPRKRPRTRRSLPAKRGAVNSTRASTVYRPVTR